MGKGLKRVATIDVTTSSNKKQYGSKPRKSLSFKTDTAISSCTRSGWLDFPVKGSSLVEYGFGCNSTSMIYTVSSNTQQYLTWAGSTDIGNLYDAYRVKRFDLYVTYNQNSGTNSNQAQNLPYIYYARDFDDIGTTATSANEVLQRPDCMQALLGKSGKQNDVRIRVVPKIANTVYGTAAFSAYAEPKAGQWISTATGITGSFTDASHYGVKIVLDTQDNTTSSATSIGNVRFYMKVYFEMKHPQ